MAEHINNQTPFSSGGHAWAWAAKQAVDKRVLSAGIRGAYSMRTAIGARLGRIQGRLGGPALLQAASNAALNALVAAIEALADSGAEYAWEDDQGHSGSALVVLAYRAGNRYQTAGGFWEEYIVDVAENAGAF